MKGYRRGCGCQLAWERHDIAEPLSADLRAMAAAPCPQCGGKVEAAIVNKSFFSAVHVVACVEPTPSEDVQKFLDNGGFGGQEGLVALGRMLAR